MCLYTLTIYVSAFAQGDTNSARLDPELSFVDREGETLIKREGEVSSQTVGQTDCQTDRQTDRQKDRHLSSERVR